MMEMTMVLEGHTQKSAYQFKPKKTRWWLRQPTPSTQLHSNFAMVKKPKKVFKKLIDRLIINKKKEASLFIRHTAR
jgi:hypothetical protein